MIADSNQLRLAAKALIPNLFDTLSWGKVWDLPIEQGKSFEWAVYSAILAGFERRGWTIEIPALSCELFANSFINDNRYPVHFTGRPGHQPTSGVMGPSIVSCLVPKAILKRSAEVLSIFKEGWPYHQIHAAKTYLERPDIVIVRGSPNFSKLKFNEELGIVSYEYLNGAGIPLVSGQLRAVNAPSPQIVDLVHNEPLSAACIVECSVNKLQARAASQLGGYARNFFIDPNPSIFMVTGVLIPSAFPVYLVPLDESFENIVSALSTAGDAIAENL